MKHVMGTLKKRFYALLICIYGWMVINVIDTSFDVFNKLFKKSLKLPPITDPILLETASEIARKIRQKQVTSRSVLEAYFMRIDEVQPVINAVVEQRREEALLEADRVDLFLESKTEQELEQDLPLLGVPISVKEVIGVKGMSYTAGQLRRRGARADRDAEVVRRLRAAGAIPIANTNTSEMCMCMETYNYLRGRTRNPHDTRRSASGSSGGEGALLGAGGSVLGIGNDMLGSVRMPAAFNGIFGHKPSRGIISNDGCIPEIEDEFHQFLTAGPMCRYADDLLPSLKIMAGDKSVLLQLDKEVLIENVKVYYMEEIKSSSLIFSTHEDVKHAVRKVVSHLQSVCSAPPEKVELQDLNFSFNIVACAVAPRLLSVEPFESRLFGYQSRLRVWKELFLCLVGLSEFTFELLVIILVEKYLLPQEKSKNPCKAIQEHLETELQGMLGKDCVFILPTLPETAPYHYASILKPQLLRYTGIFNTLGLPATSCPVGKDRNGMPIGVQVVAGMYNDRVNLAVAREIEKGFGGWVRPLEC